MDDAEQNACDKAENAVDKADNATDKRTNSNDRDRINEITARLQLFMRRAVIAFAVLGVCCGVEGVALTINAHNIQNQRRSASHDACITRNGEHQAIVDVLTGFGIHDPAVLSKFPITRNCKRYANKVAPK